MKTRILTQLMLLLLPFLSMAHPGHGDYSHGGFSVIHYFSETQHILLFSAIIALIVLSLLIYKYVRNRKTTV
jgi:hypothetical protein